MTPAEAVLLAARVVTGGAFLIIGVRNISNYGLIAGGFKATGYPAPALLAGVGIAMQIGFGALMVSTFYPAVAAIGLLAFTVIATLLVHAFWTVKDPVQRKAETSAFLGNMIMAGGLLALLSVSV